LLLSPNFSLLLLSLNFLLLLQLNFSLLLSLNFSLLLLSLNLLLLEPVLLPFGYDRNSEQYYYKKD
jgi:hypothetical protein